MVVTGDTAWGRGYSFSPRFDWAVPPSLVSLALEGSCTYPVACGGSGAPVAAGRALPEGAGRALL